MQRVFWWGQVWQSLKEDSPCRSIPFLAIAVLWTALTGLTLVIPLLSVLVQLLWNFINPWSAFYKERREIYQREKAFSKTFVRRTDPAPSVFTPESAAATSQRPAPTDLFFGQVPYEIRHEILFLAFGGRTLHMDLAFRAPPPLTDVNDPPIDTLSHHARINSHEYSHRDTDLKKEWEWFGCVCHRDSPDDEKSTTPLSYGRIRSWSRVLQQGRHNDRCREGTAKCDQWPGQWPDKCQVGIAGWLRTCRQAYVEGIRILYGENTINISSAHLLRGLQDVISPNIMSSLTSLELSWYPPQIPLKHGFTGYTKSGAPSQASPLFPNLVHLRICVTGVDGRASDGPKPKFGRGQDRFLVRQSQWYTTHMIPRFDNLVERIAPPTTEVHVSCDKWAWYKAADTMLIEQQGKEVTQPQVSGEFKGLKCWRQMPAAEATSETEDIEGELGQSQWAQKPRGYWIHIVSTAVYNDRFDTTDRDHFHLYNLGAYDLAEVVPRWEPIPDSGYSE